MTSQFAVRIAVISGMALIAFAVIFFRLWYLEVLSSEEYRAQAESNRVREITIQAPRGKILDSDGKVLVENRTALSLQVRPDLLPQDKQKRNEILRDLSKVSGLTPEKMRREIKRQTEELPANPVTLASDVDFELVAYLREHEDKFPGISAEEISVRKYPLGTLGAHMWGFVSEVTAEQLETPQYEELNPGDRVGAQGLEAQYDHALRGRNGAVQVPVDAFGDPQGRRFSEVRPKTGNNLVTTIDRKLQQVGEQTLADIAKPGAFVVMNVNDGAVLAMGSYPTFDPSIYTPPASFNTIEALLEADGDPLFNKATQSGYPTGSTFKAITGTAGLEEGLNTPATVESDGGTFEFGGREWTNAGGAAYGSVNMVKALQVSSDIYFYKLGIKAENQGEDAFQKWAERFGFGGLTGIDLPGEQPGQVPSPEWRNELYEEATKPDSPCGKEVVFDPARDCFEAADRPWSVGDNMNFAVGQGDFLATPLQLAVAYATIANGGQVVRPHVAQRVENPLGQTEEEYTPAPRRELDISDTTLEAIREGLRQAANEAGGTSAELFSSFPIEIAGKTGTAETPAGDQSWYASFAPFDSPEIAIVATFEGGGFGSETAAPAVKTLLSQYFGVKGKKAEETDPTAASGTAVE